MEMDKRVDVLEGELKLMKGELKQTLTNVRDFLLELKLPPPLQENTYDEGGSGGSTGSSPSIALAGDILRLEAPDLPLPAVPQGAARLFPEAETLLSTLPPPRSEEKAKNEPPEGMKVEAPKVDVPKERSEREKPKEEASQPQPTAQVNLLSNLFRWVSVARREIGSEQLPVFLGIYSGCSPLSPEWKGFILQLSDVMAQQSANGNASDTWSQLLLELHGVLTGGGTPLPPPRTLWNHDGGEGEAESEGDKMEEKPIRLKLVLPIGGGVEREFSLALTPEDGTEGGMRQSSPHTETN